MKGLERIIWAGIGFIVGFGLCLVLCVAVFFGWRSSQPPAPAMVPPAPQAAPLPAVESPEPAARLAAEPSDVRRSFHSLREVFDYYGTKGFVKMGQFEKSEWPATVVYVKDGTNQIQFMRKNGPRHTYPDSEGYQLKVVSLEDSSGGETIVVLRSKNKVTQP